MAWLKRVWKQARVLVRKDSVERELDDEIRFHLEMEAEKNIRRGMAPQRAWREARIAFRGVERYKEEVRGVRRVRWIEDIARDVRYAGRMLAKNPAFTLASVVTLGLGIGATTVMFGVVDGLFLSPPPGVREADDLVRLYIARDEGSVQTGPGGGIGSYPDYVALRESARGLDAVAAVDRPSPVDLNRGAEARRITGQIVTNEFFDLLRVRPAEGRFFVGADTAAASNPAVVIAHGFRSRHFGGAGDVVGRTLVLNGTVATVIGVAPEGFGGIESEAVDVWIPAAKARALGMEFEGWRTAPLALIIGYIARLEPEATIEQVEASAEAALRHAAEDVPGLDPSPEVIAGPFITARGPKRSEPATVALWVSVATGLLLLIACANVANLLLARSANRRREIAVRLSLGVSRPRLLRQLLTESLVLALLGCATGVLLALMGSELVRQFPLPASVARLNGRMLVFAGGVAAATGMLFGLVPALQALRTDPVAGLKESARTHGGGRHRVRGALVAAQAALVLVVLTGAGLFVRSLQTAVSLDPGMEVERVAMVTVDLANAGYDPDERQAFVARARERLLAIPGIEAVASARVPPLSGAGYVTDVVPPGEDTVLAGDGPYMNWVTPGFEEALGMRLVAGRPLSEADRAGTAPVAVISADLARLLVMDGDVVGACVPIGPRQIEEGGCTRIIGVTGSVRHRLLEEPAPYMYLPWPQHPNATAWGPSRLYVRTAGEPERYAGAMRAAIQGLAPDLPFIAIEPMDHMVRGDLLPLRIGATLSTLFGLLALALAAIGLHGILRYFVAERTPEIGIRRSLGARDGDVIGLVVRQGLVPVAIGAGLGLVAALAGGRLVEALLFGVSARDPLTLAAVVAFVAAVALLGSYLPARRAAKLDPRLALREE